MTLLTICQSAALRVGLPAPQTIAANTTDELAQRLYTLVNQSGKEISRLHQWRVLTKEKTFTTVADYAQTDAIPDDFDRFVDNTIINRSAKRRLVGPLTAEEWAVQIGLTASVLTDAFRIRGADLLMIPVPTAGQTVAYEYVSKNWVDTDGDDAGDAAAFSADTHTSVLDEEMLTQDVVWRYRQSTGLNYAEDHRTAQMTIAARVAADGGRRTLDLGKRNFTMKPRIPMVPEGSWNL